MSITLYSKPGFKGGSFTFDLRKVQTVLSADSIGTAQFIPYDS